MYKQVEKPKEKELKTETNTVAQKKNSFFYSRGRIQSFINNYGSKTKSSQLKSFAKTGEKVNDEYNYFNSKRFFQLKTNIKEEKNDGKIDETQSKLIVKSTDGEKEWFKFKKADLVINSFANNIYNGVVDKGKNQVKCSVEIGAQAEKEGNFGKDKLGEKSRGIHFGLGDRATGINKDYRKGKWTWHHQDGKYYMELVDMHVHGAFGHHGGYAGWQNDTDSDDSGI